MRAATVHPRTCFDAAVLRRDGWQWCATQGVWFRVVGYRKFEGGGCANCRTQIGREMDAAITERVARERAGAA